MLGRVCFFFFLMECSCFTVLLVSTVQWSESAIYIYPLFFGFPSHLGPHIALSRVPCAIYIQKVLISYLFYIVSVLLCIVSIVCIYIYIYTPRGPNLSLPRSPLGVHMSVSLFLFCRHDHQYHFSRFHIYVLMYDICFSLSDFTLCDRDIVHWMNGAEWLKALPAFQSCDFRMPRDQTGGCSRRRAHPFQGCLAPAQATFNFLPIAKHTAYWAGFFVVVVHRTVSHSVWNLFSVGPSLCSASKHPAFPRDVTHPGDHHPVGLSGSSKKHWPNMFCFTL